MRTALSALIACIGCSSHYIPRAPGRVSVIIEDGKPVYVRDGMQYEHGMLGGGLVRAVAGNPSAVAAATAYHDHIRDGLVEILVGTGAMLGGAVWAGVEAANNSNGQLQGRDIALPMTAMLGGMVLMLVGAGTAAAAEPYRWDAINMFNDGSAPMPAPTLGPPGYSASRLDAKASLHMR